MGANSSDVVREAWPQIAARLHASGLGTSSAPSSPVEPLKDHSNVFRLASPDSTADVVLKIVTRTEREVHALVNSRVPGVSPALYGWCDAPGLQGRELILMEDIGTGGSPGRNADTGPGSEREVYTAAVKAMARVHIQCTDAVRQLRLPGIQVTVSPEIASALPGCIGVLVLLGMDVDPANIPAVERLATALKTGFLQCPTGRGTLVHGDLHPSNINRRSAQTVRILDWGSAACGMAEWDLAMCDENQIAAYIEAAAESGCEVDDHVFSQRLRSATVARISKALVTGLGMVLDRPDAGLASDLLRAMAIQIGILRQAVETPRYLGFNPDSVRPALTGDRR